MLFISAVLSPCQSGVWKSGAESGQFGGIFMLKDNKCKIPNVITKACTCPQGGYSTQWIAANDPTPGNNNSADDMTYLCVKP